MAVDAAVIREWLARYMDGAVSLQDFRAWFELNTWEVNLESDTELRELFGEIELDLVEYLNGDWTEEELRRLLRPLLSGCTSLGG